MTQNVQTLDAALQAIAAEREALKTGQAGSFDQVEKTAVSMPLPLPPIPKAPGLVDKLPANLRSVTRVDVPTSFNSHLQPTNIIKKSSKSLMIFGNIGLSAVISAASVYGMTALQKKAEDMGGGLLALVKSDLGASSTRSAMGKQDKLSSEKTAKMHKTCTTIYQDLMTGRTKSISCKPGMGNVASATEEVTQFSTENTSATISSKKFNESLSRSANKISDSLSAPTKTVTVSPSTNQFAQDYSASESVGQDINSFDDATEGTGLKLKPRGIVKKFFADQ